MMINTATWGWPQWAMLVLLFLSFVANAAPHGHPMVDREDKTKPMKYNGFTALARAAMWLFLLICGGFFS